MSKNRVARIVFMVVGLILLMELSAFFRQEWNVGFWTTFVATMTAWILMYSVMNDNFPLRKRDGGNAEPPSDFNKPAI